MIRALIGLLCLSCASYPATAPSSGPSTLTLIVAGEDMMRIPGATVTLVGRDGRLLPTGKTDALGMAVIPKDRLRQVLLVLVCTEVTECTALLTSEPRFFEYDERLVILATPRVL